MLWSTRPRRMIITEWRSSSNMATGWSKRTILPTRWKRLNFSRWQFSNQSSLSDFNLLLGCRKPSLHSRVTGKSQRSQCRFFLSSKEMLWILNWGKLQVDLQWDTSIRITWIFQKISYTRIHEGIWRNRNKVTLDMLGLQGNQFIYQWFDVELRVT